MSTHFFHWYYCRKSKPNLTIHKDTSRNCMCADKNGFRCLLEHKDLTKYHQEGNHKIKNQGSSRTCAMRNCLRKFGGHREHGMVKVALAVACSPSPMTHCEALIPSPPDRRRLLPLPSIPPPPATPRWLPCPPQPRRPRSRPLPPQTAAALASAVP
jgi:hypothetical protein